nr:hypothetical protein [Tanacetum cinerariifolium]
SIPDDHVANFHYMDDARDIWNAVKARFGGNAESKKMRKFVLKEEFSEFRIGEAEGLHKGYDRMQKILSQLNQLKAKPEDEDINLKFLRALPSSWSQVALTLKTKGGLKLISFDDLYYKLKTLEVDVKGYTIFSLSQSAGPSHSTFVSTSSASKKMSYGDSPSYSSTTTYSAPSNSKIGSHRSGYTTFSSSQSRPSHSIFVSAISASKQMSYGDSPSYSSSTTYSAPLNSKTGSHRSGVYKFEQKAGRKIKFDKKESTRFNKKKVRCYKCQQRGHFARECREKGGNDKQRYSSFKIKEIGKNEEESKALITVDTLVDWTDHDGESNGVIASNEFGIIAGCDTKDAIKKGAAKIYILITGADTKEASTAGDAGEFALMGVTSEKLSSRITRSFLKKWWESWSRSISPGGASNIPAGSPSVPADVSPSVAPAGFVLEEPSSKRQTSTEAPIPSVPEVPQSPAVSSPPSSGTRMKSLARKHSDNEAPHVWSAFVGWDVVPTPLGDIHTLYRMDHSTKHFTTLRQILHMVLFDFHEGDVSYPLFVKLMEKMLTHKLEIDTDVVGNDMTNAE